MSTGKTHPIAAAVPVALVNAVAFAGQLAFLRTHLHWPLGGQILVALALESIAVYLGYHAHVAQLANDSALRLRLAAYTFAAVIGAMNYDHYAGPGWRPTFAAVAFGLMSVSSPWLWAVHSRRASRDALMARGLVEPHALRLGMTRWAWHPLRSAQVMFDATWAGITDPREAVSRWEARRDEAPADGPASDDEASADESLVADDLTDDASGESLTGSPDPHPMTQQRRTNDSSKPRATPEQRARARRLIRANPSITQAALAESVGVSKATAGRWIKEDKRPHLVRQEG
jgi:DNA-binding transcriptional regulator YiaG